MAWQASWHRRSRRPPGFLVAVGLHSCHKGSGGELPVRVWPKKLVWFQVVVAALLAGIAFLFAFIPLRLGAWSAAVAIPLGAIYFLFSVRRFLRRRQLARLPFPEEWRGSLERCVAFYRRLDAESRRRFETDVQIFLAEQRIYGVRGAEVPDDAKVLVAASAAMLGHGMPDWEWPRVRDVVVYPATFSEDYETGAGENIAGMVHAQGPILFSGPELRHGFCKERDGYNVGLHELAHVMDFADGAADGVPAGAEWVARAPWIEIVADRLRRVRKGRMRRVMRDYAGKNEAELFAVAVETFFEKPEKLRKKDKELFEMLADYFNVDPRTGKLREPV